MRAPGPGPRHYPIGSKHRRYAKPSVLHYLLPLCLSHCVALGAALTLLPVPLSFAFGRLAWVAWLAAHAGKRAHWLGGWGGGWPAGWVVAGLRQSACMCAFNSYLIDNQNIAGHDYLARTTWRLQLTLRVTGCVVSRAWLPPLRMRERLRRPFCS